MEYTKEDILIFKRVIKDYENLKKEIDERIKKGYTIESLFDYIRHLANCYITNYDLVDNYKYIDFNTDNMTLSILKTDDKQPYLGDSLEVWNDTLNMYIGLFNNINELKELVKEYENIERWGF